MTKLYDPDAGQGGGTAQETDINNTGNGGQGGDQEIDARVKRANSEAADYRRQLREIQQKLEAKEHAEADAEAERAKKQGEYQSLYEKEASKRKELESLLSDRDKIIAERDSLLQQRRGDLLDRLPKNVRKEYDTEEVSLAEIERAVKTFSSLTPAGGGNRTSTAATPAGEGHEVKDPKDVTFQHLQDLRASGDIDGYNKALKLFKSQQNGNARR